MQIITKIIQNHVCQKLLLYPMFIVRYLLQDIHKSKILREDKHLHKNHIKNINEILNPPAGTPQQ